MSAEAKEGKEEEKKPQVPGTGSRSVYLHFVEDANQKQFDEVHTSLATHKGVWDSRQSGGCFDNKLDGGFEIWYSFADDKDAEKFVKDIITKTYIGYIELNDVTLKYTRPTDRNIGHEKYVAGAAITKTLVGETCKGEEIYQFYSSF